MRINYESKQKHDIVWGLLLTKESFPKDNTSILDLKSSCCNCQLFYWNLISDLDLSCSLICLVFLCLKKLALPCYSGTRMKFKLHVNERYYVFWIILRCYSWTRFPPMFKKCRFIRIIDNDLASMIEIHRMKMLPWGLVTFVI